MKQRFGLSLLVIALLISACGRDEQGAPAPAPAGPGNAPIVNSNPGPAEGGYQAGGYCGLLCRWRMRRQQRRQPC